MNAKRYALILIAGAAALFASTVIANIATDPEDVFGVRLFPPTNNLNERNQKFLAYLKTAPAVDGLLFGSSRANMYDANILSQKMGVTNLFSAAMSYGMISDHLPLLDYILRDKAARGERIKAVYLALDADFFGKPPWTQSNINAFLPPALSGESAARYWWRYLTVYQYRLWRDVIAGTGRASPEAAGPAALQYPEPRTVGQGGGGAAAPLRLNPRITSYRRSFNSTRPDLERQIELLRRFVASCRAHGVELRIAVSPAIAENLALHAPGVLAAIVERMSDIAPLWDFTSSPVSMQRDHWEDFSHFNHRTATMILDRVYGGDETVPGFGVLRGAR